MQFYTQENYVKNNFTKRRYYIPEMLKIKEDQIKQLNVLLL